MDRTWRRLPASLVAGIVIVMSGSTAPGADLTVRAGHTPEPTSVTIAGSLQTELGCPGDWQPDCAATHLTLEAADDVWQGTWTVPAGSWEYKAPLNDSWAENYGANATRDGANIVLTLSAASGVKFYYDHDTHWVTDNRTQVIAVAPGSFQSELGCPGDWQPDCLRSWLQDPDGDGSYGFTTTDIPAGSYEAKVAINEGWDENYGAGGAPNGDNIAFTVPDGGATTTFAYDANSHLLTITSEGSGPPPDDHRSPEDVEWDGLHHDSRDLLYRTPGGAVESGTPVTLRLRTFHDDVTTVRARVFSLRLGGQEILDMEPAAESVGCYDAALAAETCDFWEVTLPSRLADHPDNLWYRFIVRDGSDVDHYVDDTPALDGGPGAATDDVVDRSWALMQSVPGFESPDWVRDAVIYQIFPDRFRNGRTNNDPRTGDVRYDDPVLALPWGTLPEGYCRNYADAATDCPWRFDDTPPDWSPTKEGPRGRDYMGGDLKGVDQQLDHLEALGVTAIYFNPIFDAGSNHSYDTQDYTRVDPYFGTRKDFQNLLKHARERGIRIILDGVFNHLSSDSPFFDRYGHYPTLGACESVSSPYREWFLFREEAGGPCAGPSGPNSANYEGWFGFDTIPVLDKTDPQVRAYFLTGPDSITKRWLREGIGGWRMDVSGDPSFPDGYWESFREVVKAANPDAHTISETWQKDSTLLRELRGDRFDTTMNYRLRDAVIGFLAPQGFDPKGFADSGYQIEPSQFAARLASQREDYPDAAYYSLMNLLDSHDTERLLWTLTPGAETRAEKELDAANVAAGKRRQRLASLIQFTVPGSPTVYYGDEVGMTGDDDPDDRRTYPWDAPDTRLLGHYTTLSGLRDGNAALTDGDFRILLADDADDTVAFGRRTTSRAAVVALNRSDAPRTLTIDVSGYVPDGASFTRAYAVGMGTGGGAVVVSGGTLAVTLQPLSGLLLTTGAIDLEPPAAPTGLAPTDEGETDVSLAWQAAPGAAAYHVYRSPVSGGGFERVNAAPIAGTSHTDTGLETGRTYFYVVTAVDAAGNESGWSNEIEALPHLEIGWANLQWPPSMSHTISTTDRTDDAYGQVWIDGVTSEPGATPTLRAQLGFGPDGSDPANDAGWTWVEAAFNVDAGNNDEFRASLLPEAVGEFDYVYRYSTTDGRDWLYADLTGPLSGPPADPGDLSVSSSGDTAAPSVPEDVTVVGASPAGIDLAWDASIDDVAVHGYEVRRGDDAGGPYTTLALVADTTYSDTDVTEGATYHYVVRAVDTSWNRSAHSAEVSATAEPRTVTLVFDVTVPATTDGTGRTVHIAGFLDRLDGDLPQWDPAGVELTRVDPTHWTVTLSGDEGTQIEYKYALGSWDYVEKDGACGEIGNRQLTLAHGSTGTQSVPDVVENWRNVAPCGN